MVRWQAIHKWLLDEGQRSPLVIIMILESIYVYLVAPIHVHSERRIQVMYKLRKRNMNKNSS